MATTHPHERQENPVDLAQNLPVLLIRELFLCCMNHVHGHICDMIHLAIVKRSGDRGRDALKCNAILTLRDGSFRFISETHIVGNES